jgi:hypothetical protein
MFQRNCGKLDRIVRLVLGVTFLPVGLFLLDGLLGQITIGISVLWLVTGASGFCILYVPFGISTAAKNKSREVAS